MASLAVPSDNAEWQQQRATWLQALREKSFAGWPTAAEPLRVTQGTERAQGKVRVTNFEYTSQGAMRLPMVVFSNGDPRTAKAIELLDGPFPFTIKL